MSLPVNPSTTTLSPEQAWKATIDELQLQMTKATFNTWVAPSLFAGHAPASLDKPQTFFIRVKNSYALDWIENRLNDTIIRTLAAICEAPVQIRYSVQNDRVDNSPTQQQPTQSDTPSAPKTHQKPNGNEPIKISGRATENPFDAGFVFVHNYALWFWRPYLGQRAFDLYLLLDSFYHEAVDCDEDWPSIAKLSRLLGHSRHIILGRKGDGGVRKDDEGLIAILEREHICIHTEKGPKHKRTHHFDQLIRVRDLPLLTPAQVAKLPKPLQNDHKRWMKRHSRHFDLKNWETDSRPTRIEPIKVEDEE